ncbi:chromosomal replication initiator protein DnaA [Erysipelothrix rhusiopathiae]|uniref:Chromosomal replication initiator protein DnaA n=2 Tax=Erysipelothrix rhusiopathiae TaxID=1648 RepID=E7FX47_ERYRH|nr:chromosomal replication initiator protein DnaA [Erysipelothrix rhusiopathiae]EFY08563.1 chromosomal replication initiator protein DnaA [Erysipelothrix rhusiopathiae ATCC 19414]AGN24999.1 chromosomal replication initiation protein [Erysipelothrix rhusiopathiae SY1027]MDE8284171.1 chromosomal replication initiator protein DnaA [Erysipelothrix rhusiopathiae]QDE01836.1 chromosomal replication initiator protein DnaA [Erysipelothrix rhusiopathiae]QDE03517.1 chromosomal replication initiator prote
MELYFKFDIIELAKGYLNMTTMKFYLEDVWGKVKLAIKESNHFDEPIYNTYIEDTNLAALDESRAVIVVPTYLQKVILSEEIPFLNDVINQILDKTSMACEVLLENEFKKNIAVQVPVQPQIPVVIRNDGIAPNQTFDNFVVGPSNKESHSAALGCAYRPGQFYTPLFIYGNSGLGKTHLLNAIGNYIKKLNPDARVLYTSSSDFVRQVANSIQNRTIEDFKEQMYNLDVLLIDDIQFLAGKEKSHEIFFHIFNELIYNKKQIVITSDRLPTEIKGLEDRLISRFSSGLSVGVDSPEFETSLAILELKIKHKSVDPGLFDEDVLSYIASNFSKDVRMLEGALNRLLFFSIEFSQNDHIDINIAMNAFKTNGEPIKTNELDTKTIKRIVADYYGLTQAQLVSKARTKAIANARHIAIYLCRKHLDLPYNKIGEDFGKRDHSTIISACDKIEKKLKTDQMLARAVYELEAKIK